MITKEFTVIDARTGLPVDPRDPKIWNVFLGEILLAQFTKIRKQIEEGVATAFHYKGSVATFDDLPTEDNHVGDMYNVEDTGANYAWTGSDWDKMSETYDFSIYLTKEEAEETYETKEDHTADMEAMEEAFDEKLEKYVKDVSAKDAFEEALEYEW